MKGFCWAFIKTWKLSHGVHWAFDRFRVVSRSTKAFKNCFLIECFLSTHIPPHNKKVWNILKLSPLLEDFLKFFKTHVFLRTKAFIPKDCIVHWPFINLHNFFPDGHIGGYDDINFSGNLFRVIDLEESTDKETIHLLIHLLMQFMR